MEIIRKYFGQAPADVMERLEALGGLYEEWNAQINVISRKDMENFFTNHVLHSLAIARLISFQPNTRILDVGTGGGFPGIPLAIFFPQCQFTLVDSIGKKIKVVNEVASSLQLTNVTGIHERAEKVKGQFDFVVSRAVTALPAFVPWVKGKIAQQQRHSIPNGILYLKGGDFEQELTPLDLQYNLYPISEWFEEPFFETKKVVHLYPAKK